MKCWTLKNHDNVKNIQTVRPRVLVTFLIFTLVAVIALFGGSACTSGSQNQPVEVVSVTDPMPPITPGGPAVEITLKNVSAVPITDLTATLVAGRSFDFNFDVSPSAPLMPNGIISQKLTMIGGGFSDNVLYPLTIKATLQSGATSVYTQQVQIKSPR